jgi:hypothetical protein
MLVWHAGVHVDAWYHLRYGQTIESFVTWPHALLYAGWAGLGAVMLAAWLERRPVAQRLPRGYGLVALGVALFGVGGLFDLVWHTWFGFESNLEVFLSPAHIWLQVASTVSAFGLVQVAVERHRHTGGVRYRPRLADLPLLLSLCIFFRVMVWSLAYSQPLVVDYASGGAVVGHLPAFSDIAWRNTAAQVAGTTGMVLQGVWLALFLTVSLRVFQLPGGAIAAIMLWDALLVAAVTATWLYLPAVVGAALAGEALWAWLRHRRRGDAASLRGYWALGGLVPTVLSALYIALMGTAAGGLIWSPHLWSGLPVLAGLYGVVASVLAAPPRFLRPPTPIEHG